MPLRDNSVDAALAVLTIHHWDDDLDAGLTELRRVARGPVVVVTYDAEVSCQMWLIRDYLPEVAALDRRTFPSIDRLTRALGGGAEVEVVPTSHDTPDWTLGSFWAHPERVLDTSARNSTSALARMAPAVINRLETELRRDLDDGTWEQRHGHLRDRSSFDSGMRLVIARPQAPTAQISVESQPPAAHFSAAGPGSTSDSFQRGVRVPCEVPPGAADARFRFSRR